MNSKNNPSARWCLLSLLWPAILGAQVASAPSTDAATLARYDTNKNGRIDPDEMRAMEAELKKPAPVAANATGDETVVLSPFEVTADTRGYQAANTMSGTRLNTKLEDLASAISVVTKEQMSDFAMLDINDIFLYAASTEGTGTYNAMVEDTTVGSITDTNANDPANANRVRGIGNANVSSGNFETSNRVPIDPIDADGVEISRGPNASIFGLGNPSGTVNILSAAANVRRNRSSVSFRADSDDGYRASLDINRVLKPGILGFRASFVRQQDGFDLKPSGVDTRRFNGMVQFRPFKRTTINASYQYYRGLGNRPNSTPALDGFSAWKAAGSPTWDPLTNSMRLNGVLTPVTNLPGYFESGVTTRNYAHIHVDPSGITYWGTVWGINGNSPVGNAASIQLNRQMVLARPVFQDSQPLIARRSKVITDKSIYDWSSINLAAPNFFRDRTETSRVTIDQNIFDTKRQSLAAQFGWFREDSERFTRYMVGGGPSQGSTGYLVFDVSERLLNGSANPDFMRPLIQASEPRMNNSPLMRDTYRLQLAYKLDFAANRGFSRWLGMHNLVGYGEYKDQVQRTFVTQDAITSVQPWTFANATANRASDQSTRGYFQYYVGDNKGGNVDYAPGRFNYGKYVYNWGNAVTGVFNNEQVELGEVPLNSSGTHTLIKTQGALLQSQFLQGRVVATFGKRNDKQFAKNSNLFQLKDRGFSFDYDFINQWRAGDWQFRQGRTEQRGVVVKPFRGFDFVESLTAQDTGLTKFFAEALRGATVHYNRSDSFKPAAPQQNVFFEYLPDPAGKGKDYGFSLNLFGGKLGLKVNKYETRQVNSRSGPSASTASIVSLDYTANAGGVFYDLQDQATLWLTAANPSITPAQLNTQLETLMGVTPRSVASVNAVSRSETDDILARGHEVELHFNPTNYWTLQASVTEQQTINSNMAPNVTKYAAMRLPFWTKIKDPRINPAIEPNQLWWDHYYGGGNNETPHQFYDRSVGAPLKVAQGLEGIARPQVRRYGARISTNLRLAGLSENRFLKRFNVGGALRYESRGAIGFYGKQQLPAVITEYDINRPIWDSPHTYIDALVGYRTKLFADKIGATFQLNVRNLTEGGHLQPFAAYPTGEVYQYRIVSPRQFILSATFDL